jgi:uncharacterized protein YjbI with pentapeptide repeats
MDPALNDRVVLALQRNGDLSGLPLASVDGRLSCRGLKLAPPKPTGRSWLGGLFVGVEKQTILSGVRVRDIDFSEAILDSAIFENCTFENCLFDRAKCRRWVVGASNFTMCRFLKSDLRGSGLGGVSKNSRSERNCYEDTQFVDADLRDTAYLSAVFRRCTFESSRLDDVDFQGSAFENCRFVGRLRRVCFQKTAFGGEHLPCNAMKCIDFSEAYFEDVEFRRLDLDDVIFPKHPDFQVVTCWPHALDILTARLSTWSDVGAREALAIVSHARKWAGARQERGVLNVREFRELLGDARASELLQGVIY